MQRAFGALLFTLAMGCRDSAGPPSPKGLLDELGEYQLVRIADRPLPTNIADGTSCTLHIWNSASLKFPEGSAFLSYVQSGPCEVANTRNRTGPVSVSGDSIFIEWLDRTSSGRASANRDSVILRFAAKAGFDPIYSGPFTFTR